MRRLLLVAAQFVAHRAGLGVPEPADHVVGDAGDDRAVGRGDDVADPLRVGVDRADLRAGLEVPPDQLAVVAAGDGLAGPRRPGR